MVVKKSHIISIALILALAAPSVIASNNLVQMDLKKSSSNSVDVTLFTSNPYTNNVIVRKKSDNKYVLLIPEVQSSGFSRAGLNGVNDLISDVDVKTVNDTTGGYTKVTLITTKPLDIKTNTRQSAPMSVEQQEYNTIMAQANAIRNTISKPVQPPQPQKTEVTVDKAPASNVEKTVDKKIDKKVEKPQQTTKVQEKIQDKVKQAVKKQETTPKVENNKPNIKLTEVKTEDIQKQERKAHLQNLVNELKQERDVLVVPENTPEPPIPSATNENLQDIKDIVPIQKVSLMSKIKKSIPLKQTASIGIPVLLLMSLLRRRKKEEPQPAIQTVKANEYNTKTYEQIAGNNNLTWQEKYQLYLDKTAVPVPRANKQGNYTFIKTPAVPKQIEQVSQAIENKKIEEKREKLEQMIAADIAEEEQNNNIMPEIVEVHNEEEVIHNTIKLKAFDKNRASLQLSKRGGKSRFKKYEVEIPLHEQKTIDLGDSPLHTNPRSLKNANLKVSDVNKNRIKYEPKEYIMSSVDEYLSIIDKEQKPVKTVQPAAQIKPAVSNPIAKQKTKPVSNLIIKSRFDIDNNKGFYVVNQGGQNALVGRVNNEVFVLKKFDHNITNPIQVRHDNANVYMVKAGGFKSLVEVKEDKMGVLIEL